MEVTKYIHVIVSNIGHYHYENTYTLLIVYLFLLVFQKSDNRKAYFMVFERGPRAFIGETVKLLRGRAAQDSPLQNLCQSASDHVNERVSVLSCLRCSLATFLAQVWLVRLIGSSFFIVY